MRATKRLATAATLGVVLAGMVGTSIVAQQPPAAAAAPQGRGAGRAGGGFRQPDPIDFEEREGWTSLFDGKTLNGWSGDRNWKIEDGAIVIESTCEQPTGTVYLVWQGGEPSDFMLKWESKGTGNVNGGIQFRSYMTADPNVEKKYYGRGGGGT